MFARVIVPLSVSGVFAVFKHHRDTKIVDVAQAVTMLNQNRNAKAAREYLEKLGSKVQLCNLNTEARLRLAMHGSCLCEHTATVSTEASIRPVGILEDKVRQLIIDEEWEKAVEWLIPHTHDENDPASYKYFLKRRRSQDLLLNRFLSQLVIKTETGFGRELIDQGILTLLMDLCNHYRTTNHSIYLNSLKILANIIVQNEYCATAVAQSEWLSTLAAMVASNIFEETLMAEKICSNGLSVFDSSRKPLKTDIYELYHPDDQEPPVFDLVLIHGIRGSVFRTWREKDNLSKAVRTRCWPRAWLPQDISVPMRILAIDYSSSLVHFTGVVETVSTRAQRFSVELKAAGVGDRPVLFICHSMGGLLLKRILLDDPELLRCTVGILFLATPHRGSPYAMYAPLGVRPSSDVKLLHQQSAINRQLHQDFLKIIDTIPVISSVAETEKAPLIMRQKGVLVPPESAYLERGTFYHINDVHHNICKPSDREDRLYGIILQFLNDAIHYVLKNMS